MSPPFPLWETHRRDVCNKIASRFNPIKILLKTKNQRELAKDWIDHHASIVGRENLIIFDNMSEQSELLNETTCQYSSFVDILHAVEYSSELYDALSNSCKFFIFLDSDERLVWSDDGDSFVPCRELEGRILNVNSSLPGTWLTNVMGYRDRYRLDHEGRALADGALWGKPLISTEAHISGVINHNTQIQHLFGKQAPHNLFVLHMSLLNRNSRIRANMQKMVALGAFSDLGTWDDVMRMNIEVLSPIHAKYVRETQSLIRLPEDAKGDTAASIFIQSGGTIAFQSDLQRQSFRSFVNGFT